MERSSSTQSLDKRNLLKQRIKDETTELEKLSFETIKVLNEASDKLLIQADALLNTKGDLTSEKFHKLMKSLDTMNEFLAGIPNDGAYSSIGDCHLPEESVTGPTELHPQPQTAVEIHENKPYPSQRLEELNPSPRSSQGDNLERILSCLKNAEPATNLVDDNKDNDDDADETVSENFLPSRISISPSIFSLASDFSYEHLLNDKDQNNTNS